MTKTIGTIMVTDAEFERYMEIYTDFINMNKSETEARKWAAHSIGIKNI